MLPVTGTVTVRDPVSPEAAKSPLWPTVSVTSSGAAGTGLAETVKEADVPSVTPLPAAMLTTGSSLSRTATAALPLPVAIV